MKKIYFVILMILAISSANAQQSYTNEYSKWSDSTGIKSLPVEDYTVGMTELGLINIQCHQVSAFPLLQVWLSTLSIKTTPYFKIRLASNVSQLFTVAAQYAAPATGGFEFLPTPTLSGADEYETFLLQNANITDPIKEVDLKPGDGTSIINIDYIKIGAAAHPVQASIPTPKVLPSSDVSVKISKVEIWGIDDPITNGICTATTNSLYIDGAITAEESLEDTSFILKFKTKAITGTSSIAFVDVTIKNLAGSLTRTFQMTVTITPKAGFEESTASELSIYPNPVGESATVIIPGNGACQLKVVNAAGQVFVDQFIAKGINTVELNTSALPSGSYQLVISDSESMISKSFSKK